MPPGPVPEPGVPHARHAAPDNLLLLAHGRADVITQARFCLLTFQHFALQAPGRYRVVVYTDQPAAFADLGENVRTEPLTPETLRRWRGPQDYVHRVKPEMLLHFTGAYDGRLLFVDSDTYFMRDPAELFDRVRPGVAALHLDEGRLSERRNGNARRLHDFVRRTTLPLPDGTVGRLSEDTAMWNSGVVGIAPEDRDLLAPSLALVDELYGRYRKHNMEQLALSYVLARRLRLVPADDVVYHYWGRGAAFDREATRFFDAHAGEDLGTLAAAAFALGGLTRRRGAAENYFALGEEQPQMPQSTQIEQAAVSARSATSTAAVLRGSASPREIAERRALTSPTRRPAPVAGRRSPPAARAAWGRRTSP